MPLGERELKGDVVEVARIGPLEKLVWGFKKDPDNERQKIHHRREDPRFA